MNLEGVLIQADALHTTKGLFPWCLAQGCVVLMTVKTTKSRLNPQIQHPFSRGSHFPVCELLPESGHGRLLIWTLREWEAPDHLREAGQAAANSVVPVQTCDEELTVLGGALEG